MANPTGNFAGLDPDYDRGPIAVQWSDLGNGLAGKVHIIWESRQYVWDGISSWVRMTQPGGGGGGGGTSSFFTQPFPTSGTAAGANDPSGNMAPLNVDSSGQLKVVLPAGGGGLTNTELRASPVPVSGTFYQATQPVSIASALDINDRAARLLGHVTVDNASLAVTGTFWQATQPVSLAAAVDISDRAARLLGVVYGSNTQLQQTATNNNLKVESFVGGTAIDPRDISDRAARLLGHVTVDNASIAVTGTFWQATQPVSGTVTANQGGAPWAENITQIAGTAIVTSLAGSPGVGGDTADGSADAGKSVKVGGKVVLNSAALPTALTASQRAPAMADEYGRFRVIVNRPKILGNYKFESGRLTVLAAAHAATAGFFWLINPVGSAVLVYLKKIFVTSVPTAVTAFASSPRLTLERVTFTGTASGATITPAKRDSTDAANTATVRTASTGLTLTAGAIIADFTVPAVLTAVGIAVPVDQWLYDATDDDDYIVLRAGEGIVFRQADAGTTSDTRLAIAFGGWEEK